MIELICQECGKTFSVYPSRKNAKYCSLKCNGASQKDKETKNRKLIHCDNCNKEFLIYENRYLQHKNHFCSTKCHDEYRENKVICKCENCGKEFERKKSIKDLGYGRFCSWSCRSKFLKGKNHFCFKSEKKICPICDKDFYPRPYYVNNGGGKYCSKKCHYKSMELERPQDSNHFYGTIFWLRLREECYKRDNYTCQKCGVTNVKLDAHHIIPRIFKGKDELDNLISLCASCHHKEEVAIRKKLNVKLYKPRAK